MVGAEDLVRSGAVLDQHRLPPGLGKPRRESPGEGVGRATRGGGHHDLHRARRKGLRRGGLGGDRRREEHRDERRQEERAYYHGTLSLNCRPTREEPERNRLRPGVSKGNPNLMANVTMMREILGVTDEARNAPALVPRRLLSICSCGRTDAGELVHFQLCYGSIRASVRWCGTSAEDISSTESNPPKSSKGKAPDEKVDPVVSRFEAAAHALPEDIRLALTAACARIRRGKGRHSRAPQSASAGHPGSAPSGGRIRRSIRPELTPSGKLGYFGTWRGGPSRFAASPAQNRRNHVQQSAVAHACQVLIVVFLVVAIAGLGVGLGLILSRKRPRSCSTR